MKTTTVQLGELVSFLSGFAFKSNFFNTDGDGLPLIRIRDVKIGHSQTYYTGAYDEKFIVTDGDYLIGMDGEFNIARWNGGKALLNQRVCKIDQVSPRLDRDYLARFLPRALKLIEDATPFATVKHLSTKSLKEIEIPLPSLIEQRRIAEVLSRVDALRTKRRESIALLGDLTESVFLDMFGDRKNIYTNWPTRKLGELLDFLTSGSRGWASHYVDEPGSLFLRIQNVRRNELLLNDVAYVSPPETAEARRTRVQPGDVLLSITADLGRTAVVPDGLGEAFINQHLSILRCSALNPHYLSAYLSTPAGQEQIMGRNRQAVKAGLNFDDVRSFSTPCPPMELQDEFAERLASTRSLISSHQKHLGELDALFAAAQYRAFRGELWDDPAV
ncbi:restriction endonuclease subunit S [Streptomyces rubiginosohelvolus]|uniref:restriction endonuclease subunit S n=1 Tax=Streptomyces rubiginosohelvolus TaxID=67362 RepID=UPI003720FAA5